MLARATALIFIGLLALPTAAHADGAAELAACNDALNSGDNVGAIAACDRAVAAGDLSDGDLAVAFTRRATADRNLQLYDEALADSGKAIAHRPDYQPAYIARGNAEGSKGDYDAALKTFGQAIALDPNRPDGYNNRGNIYNQRGEFSRALADFDAALRLAPDYAWAQLNRGIAYYGFQEYAEAAKAFDAAASADPQNAYAVLWLVLARSRAGEGSHMELISAVLVLDLDRWPGPIVKDYQLALAPLAPVISPERPAVALEPSDGEKCERTFYDGELDLLQDKPETAKPKLQQAADTCPKTYIEHAGALAELKRLSGPE
jgi:lipoprotein NlpI